MKLTSAYGFSFVFKLLAIVVTCLVPLAGAAPATTQPAAQLWYVRVNFNKTTRPMDRSYAGININFAGAIIGLGSDFDRAVASLGAQFLRFQVPLDPPLDFRKPNEWKESDFTTLDKTVEKALSVWGAKEILFCITRMYIPRDANGRLMVEDFDRYAEACAKLVQRYAAPGKMKVKYWEPFNEVDHPDAVAVYKKNGQDYTVVMDLYRRCAKRMKQVNPDIQVGGPALCDGSEWAVRCFMTEEKGTADFLSWHDYPTGSASTSDAQILRTVTSGPSRFVPQIGRIEVVMAEQKRKKFPLFLDEFHINWQAWDPADPRTASQFTAVFAASVLANLSTTAVTSAMIHDLLSLHYGLLGPADRDGMSNQLGLILDYPNKDTIHVRPVGWVYRWFNEFAGGNWVFCESTLPHNAKDGPRGRLLDACAWQNGSRRVVMLVNKDTVSHLVKIDFGEKVFSEGFSLPIRVMTIVNNRPEDLTTAGTRAGQWQWTLPAMSVIFVTYEKKR
jgi:hypothetical protein